MPSLDPALEARIDAILARLPLETKLAYVAGYTGVDIRPLPEAGLPIIRCTDSPMGARCFGAAPAYPAIIGLASSWNPALAREVAASLAEDCRARGVHILLGPGVNLARSPLCGRNFEYYGEDPWLSAEMAVAFIEGLQSNGVAATVKHFLANEQEYSRTKVGSIVDERTLRELYMVPFEACVKRANVACVMGSYNPLNGTYTSQHADINLRVLKGEWGFPGLLMSDWRGVTDGRAAALAGLDLEMPVPEKMTPAVLQELLDSGELSPAELDDKVRRMLRVFLGFGFDRPRDEAEFLPRCSARSARVARRVARESLVLLKNDGAVLPLDPAALRRVAVIGSHAHPLVHSGGGCAYTTPFRTVSVFDALCQKAGDDFEVCLDLAGFHEDMNLASHHSAYVHEDEAGVLQPGLRVEYFPNRTLSGAPSRVGVDKSISLVFKEQRPPGQPPEGFSVRWSGFIELDEDGVCRFSALCDDGIRVWIDDELIIEDWRKDPPRFSKADRALRGGRRRLRVEYYDEGGWAVAQFGWRWLCAGDRSPQAQLAAASDAAIVCVGFTPETEGEAWDRHWALRPDQEALIREIAAVNPRTVVVLFAGGALATEGWIDEVPALVHAWYPGQEGGLALAEMLLGEINPAGKLPITWAHRYEDNPSAPYYHDPVSTRYEEGIFMGYRGFDAGDIDPLFPFGHGLSYTTFAYANLRTHAGGRVSVEITNVGDRAGAEIAQLYVGDLVCSEPRPPRELKGFAKLTLAPGETGTASFQLTRRDFSFFHPETRAWTLEPGEFEISVGASSRDLPLRVTVPSTWLDDL